MRGWNDETHYRATNFHHCPVSELPPPPPSSLGFKPSSALFEVTDEDQLTLTVFVTWRLISCHLPEADDPVGPGNCSPPVAQQRTCVCPSHSITSFGNSRVEKARGVCVFALVWLLIHQPTKLSGVQWTVVRAADLMQTNRSTISRGNTNKMNKPEIATLLFLHLWLGLYFLLFQVLLRSSL